MILKRMVENLYICTEVQSLSYIGDRKGYAVVLFFGQRRRDVSHLVAEVCKSTCKGAKRNNRD